MRLAPNTRYDEQAVLPLPRLHQTAKQPGFNQWLGNSANGCGVLGTNQGEKPSWWRQPKPKRMLLSPEDNFDRPPTERVGKNTQARRRVDLNLIPNWIDWHRVHGWSKRDAIISSNHKGTEKTELIEMVAGMETTLEGSESRRESVSDVICKRLTVA